MLHKVKELRKESTGVKAAGFTIIEVMIVLAIAGLIMAMVFVAVPALQRNARTSQRVGDAQLILAAMNECLSNKNNVIASCDTYGEITAFLTLSSLKVLNGSAAQTVTTTGQTTSPTAAGVAITDTWRVSYNTKCADSGDSATVTTNPREYAIMFGVENNAGNTVPRCIQG